MPKDKHNEGKKAPTQKQMGAMPNAGISMRLRRTRQAAAVPKARWPADAGRKGRSQKSKVNVKGTPPDHHGRSSEYPVSSSAVSSTCASRARARTCRVSLWRWLVHLCDPPNQPQWFSSLPGGAFRTAAAHCPSRAEGNAVERCLEASGVGAVGGLKGAKSVKRTFRTLPSSCGPERFPVSCKAARATTPKSTRVMKICLRTV